MTDATSATLQLRAPHSSSKNAIEAENLVRRFNAVTALDHVSVQIREGEFFSLLGPSGCGKTTLLRIIAGLDTADSGTLLLCGEKAENIPAHKRPVNTVFQNYALFPHLTTWENVAFGLKMKKIPAPEINSRVEHAMRLVEITDLKTRKPDQISGGQKQRVALARAIVNEPKVLLLDEPLGALDLKLRKQLQLQLHQLQRRLGITFIHVTHDQDEALVMSDRIAVMNKGKIEQLDSSKNIYESPRTRFVAEFLGNCNLITGTIRDRQTVETSLGLVAVTKENSKPTGNNITLAIRPEKLVLEKLSPISQPLGRNHFVARVTEKTYSGAETQLRLRVGEQLLSLTQLNSRREDEVDINEQIRVVLPEDAVVVLED